ncbi:MAG: cupin domain-containing protein [Ferruginibacter sp.]
MDIDAYISSGILENYCLGFCSDAEKKMIEKNAASYPLIQAEIEKIRLSLEEFILANKVKPSPAVKVRLMLSLYDQMARADAGFAPLINEHMDPAIIASWVAGKKITPPTAEFENLYITELSSTEQVSNFIVHAKKGHETEIHDNFIEYLYVIKGSCIMDFEGVKRSYGEGEIIHIMPEINHSATITSQQPMIALVQRQACA